MSVQVKGSGTIGGLDEGLVVSGIVTSSTQINVGSNIKLGNAGIITATSFVGSGANLTSLPSQVTINNASANRVFTSDGGTTLNGEANLTFIGSILTVTNSSGAAELTLVTPSANDSGVYFNDGSNAGAVIYNHSDNSMGFRVNSSEKLRIDDHGVLRVGNTHDQYTSGNTKRIALGAKASIWGWASGQINGALTLSDNYYWDGSNNKAIESDYCAYLSLRSGSMRFGCTAASQTGGQNVSGGIHEKVRFENDGNVSIADGNLSFASGHGISFAATANSSGSMSNELFDDYEEGSFTPFIDREHGSPIVGYDAQDGYYTKIGRVVYFYAEVRINSYNGNGSYGNTFLRGLPYNSAARTGGRGVWNSVTYHSYYRDIDTTDGERDIAVVQGNSEKVVFYVMRSESSWTAPPAPDGNDQFKIGGFYFT